jgi:AcrR family transcriptional regulator
VATQQERRAGTRRALLDAAASVLVECGLVGCTTAAVTSRASVSNGALFRHFPTRLDLLAATVEHVLVRLRDDYERTFAGLSAADTAPDVGTVLELLWSAMSDPELAAVVELYAQARTDTELLAAILPIVAEHGEYVRALVDRVSAALAAGDPEAAERVAALGNLTILAMQGLVVSQMAGSAVGVERDVVATSTELVQQVLPS